MDIKNVAITAKVVIESLISLLENENVDVSSIKFKVGSASEGYESPDMEFGKLIDLALKGLEEAKTQVPEGFVLVPENNVHDHYIANHLKGTTCSVDVSELTGNDGDRIYGKLRPFDCLGSDGNTLIYDLESSNFNLVKTTGNTGGFVLVPKDQFESLNEFKNLYKRAIINAKKRKDQINWAHVAGLGVGSGRAVELCKTLNIDPSATNMYVMIEAQEQKG